MAVLVAAMMVMAMCVPAWAAPGAYKLTFHVDSDEGSGTVTDPSTGYKNASGDPLEVSTYATVTAPVDSEGRDIKLIGWTEQEYKKIFFAGDIGFPTSYWPNSDSNKIQLHADEHVYALWGYNLNGNSYADITETYSTTRTVSYNLNGGSGHAPSSVKVIDGSTYTYANPTGTGLTKDGSVFVGWKPADPSTPPANIEKLPHQADDATMKTTYNITNSSTISADTVLFAVWADDANGNGIADCVEVADKTVTYILAAEAEKDNITRTIKDPTDNAAIETSDVIGWPSNITNVVTGTKITLPECSVAKGTYVEYDVLSKKANVAFLGWTKVAADAWPVYDTTSPSSLETGELTVDSNIVLYAVWGQDDDKDGIPNIKEKTIPDQSKTNTITIEQSKDGETYKAYRMLKLTVDNPDGTPSAYAYSVESGWEEFFSDANKAAWENVLSVDDAGFFSGKVSDDPSWSDSANSVAAFAEKAAKYAVEHNISPEAHQTANSTTTTLTVSKAGYYLVISTLGTRAMVDTTPGNVTTREKNPENSISKEVKEDSTSSFGESNDAQINDIIDFKTEATIVARSINVKIHDIMDAGLSLIAGSVYVYRDAALKDEYKEATVYTTGSELDTNDDFVVKVPDEFAATASGDSKLYIVYKARLTKDAVNGNTKLVTPQKNTTQISSGDSTYCTADFTTTNSYKIQVKKTKGNTDEVLGGAVFELKKNGVVQNLVKIDETTYRLADENDAGTASSHYNNTVTPQTITNGTKVKDFITVASGTIHIIGLDNDSDYMLHEIKAPNGYNLLAEEVQVTVSTDNTAVKVISNTTTTELPTTGGMGTTVLYIVGGMLVILAGAYLFFSRKKTA